MTTWTRIKQFFAYHFKGPRFTCPRCTTQLKLTELGPFHSAGDMLSVHDRQCRWRYDHVK